MEKTILVSIALVLSACSDADTARRALMNMDMKDIEITGFRFTGCDEQDAFSTGFSAKSQSGKPVTGVVCSGWLKGATVRFD